MFITIILATVVLHEWQSRVKKMMMIVRQKKHDAMQGFLYKIRVTIVRDKYAFLLNELLKKNVIAITDEHRLSEPVIDYTTSLMGKLMGEFHDEISFSLKTN